MILLGLEVSFIIFRESTYLRILCSSYACPNLENDTERNMSLLNAGQMEQYCSTLSWSLSYYLVGR